MANGFQIFRKCQYLFKKQDLGPSPTVIFDKYTIKLSASSKSESETSPHFKFRVINYRVHIKIGNGQTLRERNWTFTVTRRRVSMRDAAQEKHSLCVIQNPTSYDKVFIIFFFMRLFEEWSLGFFFNSFFSFYIAKFSLNFIKNSGAPLKGSKPI